MSGTVEIIQNGQSVVAGNRDLVLLPSSNSFSAVVAMLPEATSITIKPAHGYTIMGSSADYVFYKPTTASYKLLILSIDGSDWTVQISDSSAIPTTASTPLAPSEGGTGLTGSGTTSGDVLTSDGDQNFVMSPSSGGGSGGAFIPASMVPLNTINSFQSIVIMSSDCSTIYTAGTLVSNSDTAILQIDATTGSIITSLDCGAGSGYQIIALSPDNSTLYSLDLNTNEWRKISTTGLSVINSITLSHVVSFNQTSLSPDGTVFSYISGADLNIYQINTSTYSQTQFATGHSSGSGDYASAFTYFNGSNSELYVAYTNSTTNISPVNIDLYTGGSYTSSITTSQSNPSFGYLASGINNTLALCDFNNNQTLIITPGVGPVTHVYDINGYDLVFETTSSIATADNIDVVTLTNGDLVFQGVNQGGSITAPVSSNTLPILLSDSVGIGNVTPFPDGSQRVLMQMGGSDTFSLFVQTPIANGSTSASGTVTSVGLTDSTGLFTITGSPITDSGDLVLSSFSNQQAASIFGNWGSSSGHPSFNSSGSTGQVPTMQSNGSIEWQSPASVSITAGTGITITGSNVINTNNSKLKRNFFCRLF